MALAESAGGVSTWPTNAGAATTGTITPASGDLLVAIAVCGNGDNAAATSIAMSGTGAMSGAWTLLAHLYLTTGPMAAVFVKDAGASPSSGTATATFSSPIEGSGLIVRRFAGAAAAASQTGVTATAGSAGGGVYTKSITPGTTGSQVVGGFADSSNSITLTANASSTIYNKGNGSGGDTLAAFEASSASTGGTPVTLGFTNTGSDSTSLVLVEILPASGVTHTASASLTVTPSFSAVAAHVTGRTASLTVTPVPSATDTAVHLRSASLTVTPSLSSAAGFTGTASLTVTPVLSGSAAVAVHASLTVTPVLSAADTAVHVRSASLTVTPVLLAAAVLRGAPAFPVVPLDLRCELLLGGTWTDVSSYVYQREGTSPPVSITRGRPDETQQAVPSRAAWQWNNRDGRFSPKNPLSPYYGELMRNTPVRFSVPATGSYLRLEADTGDYATAADNANLHVTGSIEMRIALRLSDWQGCVLAHKWDGGSCWAWQLNGDGTLTFFWLDSGVVEHVVVSATPLPYAIGDFALKVTLDVTTGTVTYYTAASIDGTYTQVEAGASGTGGAATTLRSTTAPLSVGYEAVKIFSPDQLLGRVYEYRLYNGIGGTLKADAIFTAQAAGTTSWTDAQGNSWSLSGAAEISARDYRYHGLMSSQPPKWDVTGNDMYVAAQAGGPLRIMSQGSAPPVQSPMKRAILAQPGSLAPVAYWPMEDAAGATQFGSALGGPAMTWTGGPPALASSSPFLCSAPLPAMGTGASGAGLQGFVPSYTAGGGGTWTVRFLADIGTLPASGEPTICQVDCIGGLAAYVVMAATSAGLVQLVAYDNALNVLADTGLHSWPGLQGPLWWSIEAQPSGGNVQYSLVSLAPGASSAQVINATTSATGIAGYVAQVLPVTGGGWPDTVTGHLQVQSAWVSLFSLAGPLDAWQGEAAGNRYARLAAENGYAVRIKGSPSVSALMGPQGAGTLATLLQECETADRGQMLEPRECAGLGYRTLASMLAQSAQLTLSYTSSQPGGTTGGADSGLDPTYDDLLARNDWTVTRGSTTGSQGASVRSALSDGSEMSTSVLGDYGDTKTVNVESDSQVADVAGWMVHAGTVDEHRWPAIPVNLARTEMAALQQAAMAVDAGDMVTVTSLPNQVLYDPARELALGFTEQLGGKHWTMEYQCVPASPYDVIILDDPVYGRVDTDGSTVHATAAYPQSSLSADTASGDPLWSTAGGDDPFDINVSGMRLTVTAASGSSSPQALTVTSAVNGVQKTLPAGADVRLWFPPILALV